MVFISVNKTANVIITQVSIIEIEDNQHNGNQHFVEITSNTGLKGYAGPLDGEYQFNAIRNRLQIFNSKMVNRDINDTGLNFAQLWDSIYSNNPLNTYEYGKDPLTGEDVWQSHRTARHTPTGEIITAFSAIDIALWDLRGKAKQQPVYKMLGGSRVTLSTYISCMGNKTPDQAFEKAKYWYDRGFKRHKCFLPFRPNDLNGIKNNMQMVETLYNSLPSDAEIMFDLSRLSDQVDDHSTRIERLQWACDMVKELQKYQPVWIEEPVSPDDISGFMAIKEANPSAKISAGEHLYTRWNLKPFLDKGLLDIVQCDPEWCGGISEFIEICKMIRQSYPNVHIMPHGHMILAASQCVASQPEVITPEMEYLYQVIPERTRYLLHTVEPQSGVFTLPSASGIGPELDLNKFQIVKVYKN